MYMTGAQHHISLPPDLFLYVHLVVKGAQKFFV
jgi:hypothetical protein